MSNKVIEKERELKKKIEEFIYLEGELIQKINECGPLGRRYIKICKDDSGRIEYGYKIKVIQSYFCNYSGSILFELKEHYDEVISNTTKKKKEMMEEILSKIKNLEKVSRNVKINNFVYTNNYETIYLNSIRDGYMSFIAPYSSFTQNEYMDTTYMKVSPYKWLEFSENKIIEIMDKELERVKKQINILKELYDTVEIWWITFVGVNKI